MAEPTTPEHFVRYFAQVFPPPAKPPVHLSIEAAREAHLAQVRLLLDQVWQEAFFAGMVHEASRKPAVIHVKPEVYADLLANAKCGQHGQ